MNCPNSETINQLIDGELVTEQETKLIRHLDQCPACQTRLSQFSESSLLDSVVLDNFNRAFEKGISGHAPDALNSRLKKIRQGFSNDIPAFKSGYADILPWLDTEAKSIGRVDEFVLTRFIGRGGMGVVFEAHDRKLDRQVAIKLMAPGLLADPNATERFQREAQAAAKINHANVVTIHSVNQTRLLPYLVMELVQGRSLAQILEVSPDVPFREILKVARQTALGLSAAHQSGVIHRDIKPANLMFDRQSKRIRIADFGLASRIQDTSLTQSGMMIGTPDFASPEQINGVPVDARSDLFSLGCVLYLLCTGKPPFAADSLLQTLEATRNAELDLNALSQRHVPNALIKVIAKLVKKKPSDRFQSAAELCKVLQEISIGSTSVQIDKAANSDKTLFSSKPFVWSAIALLFCLAAIGTYAWIKSRGNTKQNTLPAQHSNQTKDLDSQSNGDNSIPELGLTVTADSVEELLSSLVRTDVSTIKLREGKTYHLNRSVKIDSRVIRIEGNGSNRPCLEIGIDHEEVMLQLHDSTMTFEGVRINDARRPEVDEPLIYSESGTLRFSDCILKCPSREIAIELQDSDLTISTSFLVTGNSCFQLDADTNPKVEINDSVLLSTNTFLCKGAAQFDLSAEQSLFMAWSGFEIETESMSQISIDFKVSECDFCYPDSMFLLRIESDDEEGHLEGSEFASDFSRCFRFEARDGIVPENLLSFHNGDDEEFVPWEETDIRLESESIEKHLDMEHSIEWFIERCLNTEFDSVEQVREVLSK